MSDTGEANIEQASIIFGVSTVTLRKYIKQGMPVKTEGGRGRDYVLSLPDCHQWLKELAIKNTVGDVDQASEIELKRRKLAAETTLAEIEAAKQRGQVITIDDAVREFTHEALEVKAKLRSIPARIDHVLAAESDRRKIRKILSDEIDTALEELATRSVEFEDVYTEDDGKESAVEMGASAETKAERVGGTKRKSAGRKRPAG